jgi:class 3 adenylate cyclase/streptogramin lyase
MRTVPETISATATFLFTDIEASTELLKSNRPEYPKLLAEHHRLLRQAFAAYGGTEVDNQGDSFFVAFTRAKDAILAAAAGQRALAKHTWPGGAAVRVRMGIHTGEADLALDRYVGLSVHRAARISAIAHGGQVLVSPTTAGLLEDDDELPGIALKDLGEHRLKDIARPVRLYQLEVDGLRRTFPSLKVSRPPERDRRKRAAVVGAALLLLAGAAAVAIVLTSRDEAPPAVLPNSLVRIDADTLEPTDVVRLGSAPDLVVVTGGYVWITHHVLRDRPSGALRDAGDRTLTRVEPETGNVVTVGGGLAPCGLAADPSGDIWVANCFASGGQSANVVRVDATTLDFEATWPVPAEDGFYRGLAYGGGSLWLSEVFGADDEIGTVTQLDPRSGKQRKIRLPNPADGPLTWSEGYGDLWVSNFGVGTITRIHASTRTVETVDVKSVNPGHVLVDGEVVWVGDWELPPRVERLRAVGPSRPRSVHLPARNIEAGVSNVAAGDGYIWATTPRDRALWRIDPKTDEATRIAMPHLPTGVAANAGGVWVTVQAEGAEFGDA